MAPGDWTSLDTRASPPLAIGLDDKVRFLSRPQSYPCGTGPVVVRETHMSWIFMAGQCVYKLKKPVRFPYLDFSTLERRAAACRAEYALNRRLAPHVYLDVLPLTISASGLALDGDGPVVDWLVIMRRLDEGTTLEHVLLAGRLTSAQADRIAAALGAFYARARPVRVAPARHVANWEKALAYNRHVLADQRFSLPQGCIERVVRAQRRFMAQSAQLLADRAQRRLIVDAHGDLRPEHIFLGGRVTIIDCLEFDPGLRALDPLDEIAFLHLECERLGAAWVGQRIRQRLARRLGDGPAALFLFYRSHRALLRARLSIAHLADPRPRTPEKWPLLARLYLGIAFRDAERLECALRTPADRPAAHPREVGEWLPPAAGPPEPQ